MVGQYGRVKHPVVIVVNSGLAVPLSDTPYLGDKERVGGMNINMLSCFHPSIRALTIPPLNIKKIMPGQLEESSLSGKLRCKKFL